VNPFNEQVDFSKPYWLGVSISGGSELVPRTQFTSTGTALMAKRVMHGGVPPGMISAFAMATPPEGWLACNGQAVSRTTYSQLFAAIGTMYGRGNGSTTFNLPDTRGYFLRGWDQGRGIDPDRSSRTNRGDGATGDKVGTKQWDQYRSHRHTGATSSAGSHAHNVFYDRSGDRSGQSMMISSQVRNTPSWESGLLNSAGAHTHSFTTSNKGGNETRPKNINVFYCIKY
jgi:microcystin-dependent protein